MDFEDTIRKNIPRGIIQPRRAQIYVGFRCHQGCGFCYYKSRCQEDMFDFEFVKKQIDFEYEYGIRDFEITGGEPSEFKELEEVCEYIKKKDPSSKIAVITNGGLWARDVWGTIDEVLLSYHIGRIGASSAKSMFPKGTTFDKAIKTVEKANESETMLRTNTVVGTFNMDFLDETTSDIIDFCPKIVNFLPVNLFDESRCMVNSVDYVRLRPIIKRQIDVINERLPGSLVFVRYMPFCDMQGYEKNIVGQIQHIYDWFDWNRELDGVGVLGMVDKNPKQILGRYGSTSFKSCFDSRKWLYEKDRRCMTCKYNMICDGVERSNGALLSQIVPCSGTMVRNPMEFIGNSTEIMYRKVYGNG